MTGPRAPRLPYPGLQPPLTCRARLDVSAMPVSHAANRRPNAAATVQRVIAARIWAWPARMAIGKGKEPLSVYTVGRFPAEFGLADGESG